MKKESIISHILWQSSAIIYVYISTYPQTSFFEDEYTYNLQNIQLHSKYMALTRILIPKQKMFEKKEENYKSHSVTNI